MFGEAQVVSIRRVHDSLRNGAVIGALVGAGSLGSRPQAGVRK
jgi:ABC-type proline/glycine betaine transport system permease subunit